MEPKTDVLRTNNVQSVRKLIFVNAITFTALPINFDSDPRLKTRLYIE